MKVNEDEYIWEEKYRPQIVEDCILPSGIKKKAEEVIKTGQMQNMLFYSGPGTGKTTLAKAMCEQLGLDYIVINGSLEGRLIETVRNTVTHFSSHHSVFGDTGMKVVIYDEFDNVDTGSTTEKGGTIQMSIRGLMTEVSAGCRFIFTGNYVNRIIEPIQSRTTMVDFSIPLKEKQLIMGQIMTRCMAILDREGITYDKKVLSQFIMKLFPDFRKILNELQSYSVTGTIDAGILELITTRHQALVEAIINKDFKGCEKWMNGNNYNGSIYSLVLDGIRDNIDGKQYGNIVMLADDQQYRHAFAVDPDITLKSFCYQAMGMI